MKKSVSLCWGTAVVLSASVVASADVKVTKSMSAGAGASETTEYVKGQRTRTEMRMGGAMSMVTIQQCDNGRVVQINDATKKYFVISSGSDAAKDPASSALAASAKGGVVTVTTTITDTGERKQVL